MGVTIDKILGEPLLHKHRLDADMKDVTISGAANEDLLVYDSSSSTWLNSANHGSHFNYWNGSFLESQAFSVTSDGATITGSLQSSTSGDLTMRFSDGYTTLDCTPAVTISLTAGTDTNPQDNYVYIPQSTKVLTVSTSDWPSTEHIKVAIVTLRSASTTQTDGALQVARWNDHSDTTSDIIGHSLHLSERLRQLFGSWKSGVEPTVTITTNGASPDNVDISTTSGVVYQLHKQTVTAMDTGAGDDLHVVNHPTTPYVTITDLNTQLTDASNVSMSGRYFNLVLWGINSSGSETDHLMINLPTGSYILQADAESDVSGYTVFDIPNNFKNSGFLIAEFLFKHSVAAGGTWTLVETTDLRGKQPNNSAGGATGASGITTFLGLTDTPSAYTSQTLKVPQVNAGETALEFTSTPTLDGTNFTNISADDVNITDAGGYYTGTEVETALQEAGAILANTSGTNTGDQNLFSTIAGDSGTNPVADATSDTLTLTGGTGVATVGDSATDTITFNTVDSEIVHDNLSGFVANEHIDHSSVTLTAGVGLSGGGTIAASRSFALDLNELGTETTIASGDFLAMVDITDNGSQKITLANLASSLNTLGTIDHGSLAGLADDDHTQYPLLLGRAGGQTLIGGTAAGNGLTLTSTSNATKGLVSIGAALYVDEVNDRVGVNDTTPSFMLDVAAGSNTDGIGLNGKLAFSSNDTWLRINQSQTFTSGIYTPGNMRVDGDFIFNEAASTSSDFRMESLGNTHMFFLDSSANAVGINDSTPTSLIQIGGTHSTGYALDVCSDITGQFGVNLSPTVNSGVALTQMFRMVPVFKPTAFTSSAYNFNMNFQIGGSTSNTISSLFVNFARVTATDSYAGTIGTLKLLNMSNFVDSSSGTPTLNNQYGYYCDSLTAGAVSNYSIYTNTGDVRIMGASSDAIGFHGATPTTKQTVTGSKGGNAALGNLMTALANLGLLVDSTT